MKVSDDQNVVEIDGVKGEFVEFYEGDLFSGLCIRCIFKRKLCVTLPCLRSERIDRKRGYFKKMEE